PSNGPFVPGATRFAPLSARPWLPYFAPLALVQIKRGGPKPARPTSSSRYNFLQSDYSLWRLGSSKTIGSHTDWKVRPKGINNASFDQDSAGAPYMSCGCYGARNFCCSDAIE